MSAEILFYQTGLGMHGEPHGMEGSHRGTDAKKDESARAQSIILSFCFPWVPRIAADLSVGQVALGPLIDI